MREVVESDAEQLFQTAQTHAEDAYAVFCQYLANEKANHRWTAQPLPAWEFLPDAERNAWAEVVQTIREFG